MSLQPHLQDNKVHYKNYLLLLVICLLAYWPLTFGIFSVKNDAIHYFLPYRFNISEAIQNGEWPFWSPYIYLGNPVYGDMQSGAWNPIVWLFSLIGRYDLTIFHYENLLYIFLGGLGMYKLTLRFAGHAHTALLVAAAYMLSGFMLGGQLINWLGSAAFIPFVILYYTRSNASGRYVDAIKTAIALYLLLTAGYPSFFIITCYILLVLLVIKVIDKFREKTDSKEWIRLLLRHGLLLIVFAGLSAPAIISFIDLLPYYARGSGASYYDTVQNSFEWQHLSTLFFPSAIKATDIVSSTDVTCRNLYMGLFTVIILPVFPPNLKRRNILLIILAVFAFLFSLGDATPFRKLCYQFIPLMDSFRHPSQMRLFIILPILLLAAPGIKKLLTQEPGTNNLKRFRLVSWIGGGIFLLIILMTFLAQWNKFGSFGSGLKNTIENLQFNDVILINALIQLAFLLALIWWLKKMRRGAGIFSFLWIANLFIMAQLVLPVSFVGQTSPKAINSLTHRSPKGYPVSGLENSLAENSGDAFNEFEKIALAYFYNKKIGISRIMNSPAFLDEQEQFQANEILYNYVASRPVVYIADSVLALGDTAILNNIPVCNYAVGDLTNFATNRCANAGTAVIKKLSSNRFELETNTPNSSALVVLSQSYHHHWKVWVDGNPSMIDKTNIGFMSTVAPKGNHVIVFKFIPSNTISAMWVQLVTVIFLLILAIISIARKNNSRKA